MFRQGRIIQSIDFDRSRDLVAICPVHKFQLIAQEIIGANEVPAASNRPRGGRDINRKVLLYLINDIKCITAFAVHFVTKCQNRQIAHAANFEELLSLALNTLSAVDNHNRRVNGCEGAVGVFREI